VDGSGGPEQRAGGPGDRGQTGGGGSPGKRAAGAGDRGQLGGRGRAGERAAQVMELLGLNEDELCQMLDADPLTLLSGQLDHRTELPILLALIEDASEHAGSGVLRRWVRASGPHGRPIELLLRRDFAAFEGALGELARRGFVLRGGA
jgi:hypothetical protein